MNSPDLAAIALFVLGATVLSRFLTLPVALALTTLRVGLFYGYFVLGAGSLWRLLDDITYIRQGIALSSAPFNVIQLLVTSEGRAYAATVVESRHYVYGVWNAAAIETLGPHYYAPVVFNIALSFVGGWLFSRLTVHLGLGERTARVTGAFFVLHPTVVSWSSFVNVKDTLALVLAILSFVVAMLWTKRRTAVARVALMSASIALLGIWTGLRLYVPLIFCASLLVAASVHLRRHRALLTMVATTALAWTLALRLLAMEGQTPEVSLRILTEGLLRGLTTPRFWAIEPNYDFLLVAAVIHWAFLPLMGIGIVLLWQVRPWGPALLAFAVGTMTLGVLIPEMQGPRQRLQVEFVVIMCQYLGFRAADRARRVRSPLLYNRMGRLSRAGWD